MDALLAAGWKGSMWFPDGFQVTCTYCTRAVFESQTCMCVCVCVLVRCVYVCVYLLGPS